MRKYLTEKLDEYLEGTKEKYLCPKCRKLVDWDFVNEPNSPVAKCRECNDTIYIPDNVWRECKNVYQTFAIEEFVNQTIHSPFGGFHIF